MECLHCTRYHSKGLTFFISFNLLFFAWITTYQPVHIQLNAVFPKKPSLILLSRVISFLELLSPLTHLSSSISWCCTVAKSCLTLQFHGLQQTCPSPSPRVCPSSCPLNQWYYPTISSSVVPFSSCLQSFLASGSFPMSRLFVFFFLLLLLKKLILFIYFLLYNIVLFASRDQSIGALASASVLPMSSQGWFPFGLTSLISLLSSSLLLLTSVPDFRD